jgi:hypothetical protein
LGKKGKIFENSKFRTLLISCSVTAENVHFTIATRILLCPQNGDTKIYYVRSAIGSQRTTTHFRVKKPDFSGFFGDHPWRTHLLARAHRKIHVAVLRT